MIIRNRYITPPPSPPVKERNDRKLCERNCMTKAIWELNMLSRPGLNEWEKCEEWQGMAVTRECEVGMAMRNKIVQCGCLTMPLNRQV